MNRLNAQDAIRQISRVVKDPGLSSSLSSFFDSNWFFGILSFITIHNAVAGFLAGGIHGSGLGWLAAQCWIVGMWIRQEKIRAILNILDRTHE